MPILSKKSMAMPASPIRKLVPFAEAAKSRGTTVYHLNIGQPDIETPKIVRDKLNNLDLEVIEYSHSAGFLTYREGLAKYYQNLGISLDPDKEIMITTGGSEALTFAFQCCFEPGDEIIIMLWGETELNEPYTVTKDGYIFVDNIGQVFVNGLTLVKLEKKLFRLLKKAYASLDPVSGDAKTFFDVSLGGLVLRPLKVFVLGSIAQPGAYILKPSTSLFTSLFYFHIK